MDLIDASAAKNPKLMLRRTESVVEKMLTNWMSICMYSCLRVRAPGSRAPAPEVSLPFILLPPLPGPVTVVSAYMWERGWPTGSVIWVGESRLRATLGTETVSGALCQEDTLLSPRALPGMPLSPALPPPCWVTLSSLLALSEPRP